MTLSAYPAGLDAQAEAAQRRADALALLGSSLPHLEEWRAARSGFHASRQAIRAAEHLRHGLASPLDAAHGRCESATAEAERRAQDESQTVQAATRSEMLLQSVAKSIVRFEEVEGEASCRHCGQPLTAEHREAEAARLERERASAQSTWEAAVRERDGARQVLAAARAEQDAAVAGLSALQKQELEAEQSARATPAATKRRRWIAPRAHLLTSRLSIAVSWRAVARWPGRSRPRCWKGSIPRRPKYLGGERRLRARRRPAST